MLGKYKDYTGVIVGLYSVIVVVTYIMQGQMAKLHEYDTEDGVIWQFIVSRQ